MNELLNSTPRQPFPPAAWPAKSPLCDHPYYKHLLTQYHLVAAGKLDVLDCMSSWLGSLGFDTEKHFLTEHEVDCLRYCEDIIQRGWRPKVYQLTFDELFTIIPVPADQSVYRTKDFFTRKFPIWSPGNACAGMWIEMTPKLSAIVDTWNVIYKVCPKNLYLKIEQINGKHILLMNYQQILGGRSLATVTDFDADRIKEKAEAVGYKF